MIINSIHELSETLDQLPYLRKTIVAASGGFDPLHIGHIRYLQEAADIGLANHIPRLLVIVNTDEFLVTKKNKPFMPLEERMEIIAALACTWMVVPWHQEDSSVSGALELIKPRYFAKGGDRTLDNIPERETCERLGIEMVFNVGGGKVQSSSWLLGQSNDPAK
ncbi:MAG: adenylyltransferase/cytidyltransferase family protein [Candidatus Thorarchaeota archaeon]|jgi:D-beta-D-heptose 7-phosphate kinase/D-beta-D-heptose 1-phosphate adenosyltransferase